MPRPSKFGPEIAICGRPTSELVQRVVEARVVLLQSRADNEQPLFQPGDSIDWTDPTAQEPETLPEGPPEVDIDPEEDDDADDTAIFEPAKQ